MPWVLFWVFPVSLTVLWAIERHDARVQARNSRTDLAPVDLDHADRVLDLGYIGHVDVILDQLLPSDRALIEDGEVAWLEDLFAAPSAPGGLPMRPFDPSLHTYPRRPARHGSHRRLHRGF